MLRSENKHISTEALNWLESLTDKERFTIIEEAYQEACSGI